jgi:hypothetical protein
VKTIESNICSIKLLIHNSNDKMQALWFINIYNSCSLSIIFTEKSLTISWLDELIKDNCKHLIVKDFNLHHSHWEDRRCFSRHTTTDALLNVVTNARLKLLLESNIIIQETYNQLTTIDLIFDSKKIQFMIHKCKVRINLHQSLNHLSMITELCLCTFFMQSSSHQLWKKMNTKSLSAHLRIHLTAEHLLNDKAAIDDRVMKITYILQKVIEKSTSWTKSLNCAKNFWNQNCSEVVMKSRRLQIIWKMQSTLEAWNDYLKYNDHKNKIIREMKHLHFRSQMHELNNELKSIWCFAK